MKSFPELKKPLDRRTLEPQQGRQLLAYDIVQRLAQELTSPTLTPIGRETLINDAEANLHILGLYIAAEIGVDRFLEEPTEDGESFGFLK